MLFCSVYRKQLNIVKYGKTESVYNGKKYGPSHRNTVQIYFLIRNVSPVPSYFVFTGLNVFGSIKPIKMKPFYNGILSQTFKLSHFLKKGIQF